jgi:hypothetical protein
MIWTSLAALFLPELLNVRTGSRRLVRQKREPQRSDTRCGSFLLPAVVAKYGEHRGHGLMQSLKRNMNGKPSFADPANLEPKTDEAFKLEPNATSLNLLQAIYRSAAVPLMTRMRAAITAIQFEHPKLQVTATVESGDFAFQLDQAVERSRRATIEAKPIIEANTSSDTPSNTANVSSDTKRPHVEASNGVKPFVLDRRYRRW